MQRTTRAPERIVDGKDLEFLWAEDGAGLHIELDMSDVRWVSPMCAVALLARCLAHQQRQEAELTVALPKDPYVRTYLDRIGFFRALSEQGIVVDTTNLALSADYNVRPCLPVTKVSTSLEADKAADVLWEMLDRIQAPSNVKTTAFEAITEFSNNAREHGSECYVVAQTHSGETSETPGLHFAVADFGPGFKATLAARSPGSEQEALDLAFQEGVSRLSNQTRGSGLPEVLRELDSQTPNAIMQLMSRDTLRVHVDGKSRDFPVADCGGVFVNVYFPY